MEDEESEIGKVWLFERQHLRQDKIKLTKKKSFKLDQSRRRAIDQLEFSEVKPQQPKHFNLAPDFHNEELETMRVIKQYLQKRRMPEKQLLPQNLEKQQIIKDLSKKIRPFSSLLGRQKSAEAQIAVSGKVVSSTSTRPQTAVTRGTSPGFRPLSAAPTAKPIRPASKPGSFNVFQQTLREVNNSISNFKLTCQVSDKAGQSEYRSKALLKTGGQSVRGFSGGRIAAQLIGRQGPRERGGRVTVQQAGGMYMGREGVNEQGLQISLSELEG